MEEEKMTIKLPKDFFFGAAMSGPPGGVKPDAQFEHVSKISWSHSFLNTMELNMKKILNY